MGVVLAYANETQKPKEKPPPFRFPGPFWTAVLPEGEGESPLKLSDVIAVTSIMSSTEHPLDKSLAGFASPCSIGPIALAPASRSVNL